MLGTRLLRWTIVTSVAALGAAAIAWGATRSGAASTGTPYDQVVGSATIDAINTGKPFDIRGVSVGRDGSKFSLTLVRSADAATMQLMAAILTGKPMNVTLKLSVASATFSGVHVLSDSVGAVGGNLEQVMFGR